MCNIYSISLFGGNVSEIPHPDANWKGFLEFMKTINSKVPMTWCPVKLTSQPWFLINKISEKYGGKCQCLMS